MTHYEEYYKIINNRKTNPVPAGIYCEKHHIKPRSLYPDLVNDPNNIVTLTASEHFIAHYHLWKYYKEELKDKVKARSMCFAFTMMKRVIQKSKDIERMSMLYEEVRKALKGIHLSKETRKRISEANKGRVRTEETKRKISEILKGRKLPEIVCKHISESKRGTLNPNYQGKSCTELTRKKLSIASKGRVFSKETCKKISEKLKGHIVTKDTRKKIGNRPYKYGSKHANAKKILQYSKDGVFIKQWNSLTECSKELKIDISCISSVLHGRQKLAGGFSFLNG